MPQPTQEELALLAPITRRLYRVADWMLRNANVVSRVWITTFLRIVLWFCGSRRFRVHGQDHLDTLTADTSAIVVANHRSFFDFFVVSWATVTRSRLTRRILFPVRADFFYDRWIGGILNMIMTGMAMFPPIARGKEQMPFNRFAMGRLVAELSTQPTFVGIHPEGKRNTGDPYELLPAQPGVGKLVLAAEEARVIPIFVLGITNNLPLEIWRNWTNPENWPIDICVGPDIDLTDLRESGSRASIQLLAARRCMESIAQLAENQRMGRQVNQANSEAEEPQRSGTIG
jgi:1-acyl-sn-glycerol-3-phosphate acyltransferase